MQQRKALDHSSEFRSAVRTMNVLRKFHFVICVVICNAFTISSVVAQTTGDPKEFVSLRESWQKARKQATDPIDSKYLTALRGLKSRFATDGKLEEAIIVDKEIKRIEEENKQPDVQKQSLLSEIEGTEWRNIRGHEIIHFRDKKLYWGPLPRSTAATSSTNAWTLTKENGLVLNFQYRTGFVATLKFDKDLKGFLTSDGDRTFSRIDK